MKSIKKSLRRLKLSVARVGNPSRILQKRSDVSDSELYLMYALDDGMPHSQMQIAEEWRLPRTTLNTIVKRWEHEGLIVLSKIAGKRREKEISLTDKGRCKIKKTLGASYLAENRALALTLERYSDTFIEALEFYADALKHQHELIQKGKRVQI